MTPAVERVDVHGGRIAVLDWGGSGPTVVLLHPNGFCAGLYEPVATRLVDVARVVAVDLPGHGGSTAPGERDGYGFGAMAERVVAALDQLEIRQPAVVGGSLGGAVAILADRLRPGCWSRALLAEAVAFPAGGMTGPGEAAENPMAAAARRRRARFADRAAMVEALSGREPLSQLAPEALQAYARWGTVADGDGVRLACAPEVEATVFEVSGEGDGAPAAWAHLPELSCPTTVVAGRDSFLPDMFAEQAQRAGAELVLVDGGHFVLHEDSVRGAQLIRRHALAIPESTAALGR
ncbi:MAG: alpha/beta fold hydrolase [Acidimicrobiia bacterium]